MKCEQLPHGFRLHDMLEVVCCCASRPDERRKWGVLELRCGNKVFDVTFTKRTLRVTEKTDKKARRK